jgi:hypothetical protein
MFPVVKIIIVLNNIHVPFLYAVANANQIVAPGGKFLTFSHNQLHSSDFLVCDFWPYSKHQSLLTLIL